MNLDKILVQFQLVYQEIFEFYNSKKKETEKWKDIATHLHDNNNVIVSIFNAVKKQDTRKEIALDYDSTIEQLNENITAESNSVVKASLIISALHKIIYELLSTEGNYLFTRNSKKEMNISIKNITYYISVSTKREQNVYFHAFILIYGMESLFNPRFYIGIDFEYTNKKIELAQLNFEHNKTRKGIIMVVSPNELEPVMTTNFINLIMCNRFIKKILHGSDSLDIPYVYEHLLENDPERIRRFTRTLIDTRFLCEYYKLNKDPTDNRCSVYDQDPTRSAIYYFGLVSEEQQRGLTELLESMPPSHDLNWKISRLPSSQIIYAITDVIYLKWFYLKIINVATKDEPTELGKKSIIELYKHVLYELTQWIYLEKKGLTYLAQQAKTEVDPVNNYMIRKPGKIMKLIDVYNEVSPGIMTTTPKAEIDKIIKVNYYKATIITLLKKMVYTILSRKCKIYKDKNTIWTDKLDNQYIFDFFQELEFKYLNKMFKEIETILETRIKTICP